MNVVMEVTVDTDKMVRVAVGRATWCFRVFPKLCKFVTVGVNNMVEGLFNAGAGWLRDVFVIINPPNRCVYFKLLKIFMW